MSKKILKWILTGITFILFILTIVIMFVGIKAVKNNELVNIFGYSYSVVPTTSMVPEIYPEEIVISKIVSYDSLKKSDIVIYYSDLGNRLIVHRIIGGSVEEGFVVKGDNNKTEDDELVTVDNYRAKVIAHGNYFYLGSLMTSKKNAIFFLIVILFLYIILSESIDILHIMREKKRLEKEPENESPEEKEERLRKEILSEIDSQKNEKK